MTVELPDEQFIYHDELGPFGNIEIIDEPAVFHFNDAKILEL